MIHSRRKGLHYALPTLRLPSTLKQAQQHIVAGVCFPDVTDAEINTLANQEPGSNQNSRRGYTA